MRGGGATWAGVRGTFVCVGGGVGVGGLLCAHLYMLLISRSLRFEGKTCLLEFA